MSKTFTGRIVAAHGRHYLADCRGERLQAVPRGKKSNVAVGDIVELVATAPGQAVIEAIQPRRTLLYRSDQYRKKLLAANVDQLFIVVATEPSFSEDLLSRALVAAESAGVRAVLILNKSDLAERLSAARERLAHYAARGYPVLALSATAEPDAVPAQLLPLLNGQISILIGQSGMGKSTLLNLLVPEADAAVREISTALNSGRHTTTHSTLYTLDADTALIDSPGFQEFGLAHLTEGILERAFVDFAPYLGHCRFYNCHHVAEPDCAVRTAVVEGKIRSQQHELYVQLLREAGKFG